MAVGDKKRERNTVIIFAFIVLFIILVIMYFDKRLKDNEEAKNEVVFTDITFQVTGYYGNIYSLDKVQKVELKDDSPTVIEQISGVDQDDFKRGDFETEEYGKCRMYILKDEGPYIYIYMDDLLIVMDQWESEQAYTVYNEFLEAIQ